MDYPVCPLLTTLIGPVLRQHNVPHPAVETGSLLEKLTSFLKFSDQQTEACSNGGRIPPRWSDCAVKLGGAQCRAPWQKMRCAIFNCGIRLVLSIVTALVDMCDLCLTLSVTGR
eukprot:749117-Hanusia_phi.AAC.3